MRFLNWLLSQFTCKHRNVSFPIQGRQACLDCGKIRDYEWADQLVGPWHQDVLPKKVWQSTSLICKEETVIFSKFIEGLQILQKYFDEDGYLIGAEHDEFFVYATDRPLSKHDAKRMVDLGWFQNEAEVPGEEEFSAEYYDADEGWGCFV